MYRETGSVMEKILIKDTTLETWGTLENRQWSDLPLELLDLVMQNLSLADRVRVSTLCKSYQRALTYSVATYSPETPFLLFLEKQKSVCKFYDATYKKVYVKCIPELSNVTFHYSKDGWLLLSQNNQSYLFFFNPFTDEKVELPPLSKGPVNFTECFHVISFSSPPTSEDCIVFAIQGWCTNDAMFYTCHPGDTAWEIAYDDFEDHTPLCVAINNPVYFDGAFYCLGGDGKLGVFNTGDHSWEVQNLERPGFVGRNLCLVESQGEILCVFRKGVHVIVYQFDRSKMAWVRMKSLGNRMLFIDQITSLSATVVVTGTENKVYFPNFRRDKSHDLVFYSLETKKCNIDSDGYKGHVDRIWVDPKGLELVFGTKSSEENPLKVLGRTQGDLIY